MHLKIILKFLFYQVTGSLWAANGCYDPDIAAMNGGERT